MRSIGSAVLPYLVRPDSLVQEGGEDLRGRPRETVWHSSTTTADRLELSLQAREIQRLHQFIQDTPEIREPRVVEAQQALTARTLPLDGYTLASKLISEALHNAASRPA
jgi:Anti-sigma-28 factor, FlgM